MYGFNPSYKTWIHHGEPDLPPPPPVINNIRQPQMSDMTACLKDLSYIPLNNEQNEPTQGDICETKFFQNVFPMAKGYKLPPSYYAITKTFKMIGLGYESIHACVNNCFLFRGDANKDVHFCLVCNTSRWKDSNTPGKKVPKKALCYFSIIPRLQHLYEAWKDFDTKYPDFAAEPRNVRLGLAVDGFNPFDNLSQSYSIWPAKPGVKTIDVATGQKFNMRAMVPWNINDFPSRSSLSGWSRKGYRACPTCNEDTLYVDPPREFSRDEIMTQLARLPTRVKGKHLRFGGMKIKHNVLVELNWTKRSIFNKLGYWSFLTLKHNLDVIHIEKNVLESILNTLLMNDKSKDTAKARQDLERLGI
ncbi:zinc finger, PHD-type containing protein [Tanacetum coccineum]|uniref:Zinc finger, PHD-type containing protein n=1 Tax=Tanacetum coccineum TaxID=301880 RepID=A0ABQ4ZGD0_9ASTR